MLNKVNIGDVFKVVDVLVQATQPRQPCYKLDIRFEKEAVIKAVNDPFIAKSCQRDLLRKWAGQHEFLKVLLPNHS